MGILDDFLLGRGGERNSLDSAILKDYLGSEVVGLSNKGIVFERPNVSGSTIGAATALLRTTGRLPEGFFNGISDNAPNAQNSSIIAFDQKNGQANFESLRAQGVDIGTTLGDLAKKTGGSDIKEILEVFMNNKNASPASGSGFGSVTKSANGTAASGEQGRDGNSFVQNFLESFKRKKQGALKPLSLSGNASASDAAEGIAQPNLLNGLI